MIQNKLTTRQVGDVLVIDIVGKITLQGLAPAVRDKLKNLSDSGCKKILVNLKEVTHLDTNAIGEFVGGYSRLQMMNGELKFFGISGRVKALIDMINMPLIFRNFESEEAALASFDDGSDLVLVMSSIIS